MPDPARPDSYERAFVEWLVENAYKKGFDDGVTWSDEMIETQLWRMIDPGPELRPMYLVNPPNDATRALTRDLIDAIRPTARLRAKQRRSGQ